MAAFGPKATSGVTSYKRNVKELRLAALPSRSLTEHLLLLTSFTLSNSLPEFHFRYPNLFVLNPENLL